MFATNATKTNTLPATLRWDQQWIIFDRAYRVERNFRTDVTEKDCGQIFFVIQDALSPGGLREEALHTPLTTPLSPNELVLSHSPFTFIKPSQITEHPLTVELDYHLEDTSLETRDRSTIMSGGDDYQCPAYICRRYFEADVERQSEQKIHISPLAKSNPVRGELEMQIFGRKHLESYSNQHTISIPFLNFQDGFGLYRNPYKSLMGWYVIPAGLTFQERARRASVYPLTFGPHGSDLQDVIRALASVKELDAGVKISVHGKPTLLCAFTIAYIGDMPQQQINPSMKSQNATKGCR